MEKSQKEDVYPCLYIFESLCCTPEPQHCNQLYFSKKKKVIIFYSYLLWMALHLCRCLRAASSWREQWGTLLLWCVGFSMRWFLLLGARAPDVQAQ